MKISKALDPICSKTIRERKINNLKTITAYNRYLEVKKQPLALPLGQKGQKRQQMKARFKHSPITFQKQTVPKSIKV